MARVQSRPGRGRPSGSVVPVNPDFSLVLTMSPYLHGTMSLRDSGGSTRQVRTPTAADLRASTETRRIPIRFNQNDEQRTGGTGDSWVKRPRGSQGSFGKRLGADQACLVLCVSYGLPTQRRHSDSMAAIVGCVTRGLPFLMRNSQRSCGLTAAWRRVPDQLGR